MAKFTVADIKELRELTGAGMMDIKNALQEADGDKEEAVKIIRLAGQKSLSKREGRAASAGLIAAKVLDTEGGQVGVMVELNSETDFVAKNEKFIAFGDQVLDAAIESEATTVAELEEAQTNGQTVKELVDEMAALVGEKVVLSHVARVEGEHVSSYLHLSNPDLPPQVGVLVATDQAAQSIAHDVALHIAVAAPEYLDRDSVPADKIEKERSTLEEITRKEGKPDKIIDKIVAGRMNAFYKEIVLLDQEFSKDPSKSVGKAVAATNGKVVDYARFRVSA